MGANVIQISLYSWQQCWRIIFALCIELNQADEGQWDKNENAVHHSFKLQIL